MPSTRSAPSVRKGCNTTAWIKAKPEWAKGSQLIRFTPRFNPDVNGYWMCDIGRFDYHWIEGDDRLRRPLERVGGNAADAPSAQLPVSWHELTAKLTDRLAAAGTRVQKASGFCSLRMRRTRRCFCSAA